MGRLDDIIERNKNPKRTERMTVGIGVSLFLLLIILLMTLTDLGIPRTPSSGDNPAPPPAGEKRVNDVQLR